MNISDQIIAIINDLCKKLGIVIDWSAENVLPKVEELCTKYIKYEITTSYAWILLWCGITLLSWIIAIPFIRYENKKDDCDRWDANEGSTTAVIIMIAIACCISFITICVVGCQIFDIVEAKVFPEKTIYEFVSSKLQSLNSR